MRDLINSQNIKAALTDLFGPSIRETLPARLGKQESDSTWILRVPPEETDRPNMYYVSNAKNAAPFVGMALNTGPTPLPDKYLLAGMPIRIRKEPSGTFSIHGLDTELAAEFIGEVNVQPPQAQIPLEQFLPGMLDQTDPPSLGFRVMGAPYAYGEDFTYVNTQTITTDITSLADTGATTITLPSAGSAKYVLVQLDFATEALSYKQGDTFAQTLYHTQAMTYDKNNGSVTIFPQPDVGNFRCGYIRLQSDTTELKRRTNFWTMQTIFSLGSGTGTVTFDDTQGETLAVGDPVYQSDADDEWYVMDTDATPPLVSRHRAIVTDITSAPTVTLQSTGLCSAFTGLTAGDDYWVDTDGTLTNTRPTPGSGSGQIALVYVGRAVSATAIDLKLDTPVQYMIRDDVADDGTLTIEHHADPDGRLREVRARISTDVAGSTLTEYTSGNQDGTVALEGPSGAGATVDINATGGLHGIGNTFPLWPAQSFQITAGILTQFKVTLGVNLGTPTGTVTWEFQTDNAGEPSGTVLKTGTFTPTASAENTINVTNGPFLAASTLYWLVLKNTSAQSSGNAWQWQRSTTTVYADGYAAISADSAATWTTYPSTRDAECEITTDPLYEYDRLAQGFQVTGAQTPYSVSAYLRKVGTPTGTLTAAIFDEVTGNPASAITNGTANTVAESSLSTSFALVEFVFATPPSLSGSTQYYLVLDTDRAGSSTNYVEWGVDTSSPSYGDGTFRVDITGTWDSYAWDAVFSVDDVGTTFDGAVDVGHITVGAPTVGTRFDDGAGADADTNTTFQNLAGSELDLTCIVELP